MVAKRFTMIYFEDDGNLIFDEKEINGRGYDSTMCLQDNEIVDLLNTLYEENQSLKHDLKECKRIKSKRNRRLKNQRAVLDEIGGVIIGYKNQLKEYHYKIDKLEESLEDKTALSRSEIMEILNE